MVFKNYMRNLANKSIDKKYRYHSKKLLKKYVKNIDQFNSRYGLAAIDSILT